MTLAVSNIPLQSIKDFQEFLLQHPETHVPVVSVNHHSDGILAREMFMEEGCYYVGKEHSERHLNILLSGRLTVWTVHGRMNLVAPAIFESMAGVKKVGYAHTACRYLTVHPNPSNERNEDILEGMFIRPEEQMNLFPYLDNDLLGDQKCLGE